jgi:hypothetical protein
MAEQPVQDVERRPINNGQILVNSIQAALESLDLRVIIRVSLTPAL